MLFPRISADLQRVGAGTQPDSARHLKWHQSLSPKRNSMHTQLEHTHQRNRLLLLQPSNSEIAQVHASISSHHHHPRHTFVGRHEHSWFYKYQLANLQSKKLYKSLETMSSWNHIRAFQWCCYMHDLHAMRGLY